MQEKIDVVIPWVDDNDTKWIEKKNHFSGKSSIGELDTKNRYHDYGTLLYVLRSIEKNMPWINDVFLLTDHQVPEWINLDKVRIVDHTHFIDGKLPTFNSNVIMTSIGKIKELSDKFIVFNDEFIVWNKVEISDYFQDGLPVDSLIETGTVPKIDGFFHISQNGVALANEKFSKRAVMLKNIKSFFNLKYGIDNLRTVLSLPYAGFLGFQNKHLTVPYRKNDFILAYELCPEAFQLTWTHQFRELSDINEWTVRYLRNLNGDFIPGYLHGQFFTLSDFKKRSPKVKKNSKIVVVNDDGFYETETMKQVHRFLQSRFSEVSKYEK